MRAAGLWDIAPKLALLDFEQGAKSYCEKSQLPRQALGDGGKRNHYQIVNPVTREDALKPMHCCVDFTHQRWFCMAPRLIPKAHRALTLLVNSEGGAASELFMTANGVKDELLDKLVRAKLVTVAIETMQTDIATVKVKRFRITDDGRKALAVQRR